MKNNWNGPQSEEYPKPRRRAESGFSLVECLVSSCILIVISTAIFEIIAGIPSAAAYQADVQSVMNNARIALETTDRIIRQAGNDPHARKIDGLTIYSPTEIRIQSDLTGSMGPSNPDKGDPDGDIEDSGEDVVLRYDPTAGSIEVGTPGGSMQSVVSNITTFTMQFLNASRSPTSNGTEVRRVDLTLSATGTIKHPHTGRVFALQIKQTIIPAMLRY